MKKIIVTIMSVLMLFTTSLVPAFAAESAPTSDYNFISDCNSIQETLLQILNNYKCDKESYAQGDKNFFDNLLSDHFKAGLEKVEKHTWARHLN